MNQKLYIMLTILLGGLLSVLIVGLNFSKMQLKTHLEIISFWNRNWKNLRAHQFKDSKFYFVDNNAAVLSFINQIFMGYMKLFENDFFLICLA